MIYQFCAIRKVKIMNKVILCLTALFIGLSPAKAEEIYLFYNASSDNLDELEITKKETADIFDGEFGPAADELPQEVRFDDFYVAKYPDGQYVFILNAPINCGRLGCKTIVFERDEDDDLVAQGSHQPVKCKIYDTDKLVCTKGGYQPEVSIKPKKKILHFYPPQNAAK